MSLSLSLPPRKALQGNVHGYIYMYSISPYISYHLLYICCFCWYKSIICTPHKRHGGDIDSTTKLETCSKGLPRCSWSIHKTSRAAPIKHQQTKHNKTHQNYEKNAKYPSPVLNLSMRLPASLRNVYTFRMTVIDPHRDSEGKWQ